MLRARNLAFLLALTFSATFAQQSTPYILTEFPIAAMPGSIPIWIKWTGASRNITEDRFLPDSGTIYYSTSPGGSVIENYTDSVTVFYVDTVEVGGQTETEIQYNIRITNDDGSYTEPPQRGTKFRPSDQPNMGPGVYYYMVAWRTKVKKLEGMKIKEVDTTFFSKELQMIVEADTATELLTPGLNAEVTDLTPTFTWKRNTGVPYYHVIISDEEISPNLDSQTVDGLSIIWQAITPSTQITYGAPDPSGTITASPPPLSPGQTYSWIVLNNYGNHPAYTSTRFGLPRTFTVMGEPLDPPLNAGPSEGDTLRSDEDPEITFKWTNLDPDANTYKIYLYVASDFEQVGAQLVVWDDEVTAGQFEGQDTASFTIDARSVLTNNKYTWKVMAVDDKGAGRAGNISSFYYRAPTGKIRVKTKEKIAVGDTTFVKSVAAVEIKVEVLNGSMEAPLLFYTDTSGTLSRDRPTGTYRLTAIKDGFESQSRTIEVTEEESEPTYFYLKRPDATVFGKLRTDGQPLKLATVLGVSERGDTVKAESDALGNFVLNCYQADWKIWAAKEGYTASRPRDTTVEFGQNVNFGEISLKRNPNTLSGIIKNQKEEPLLGVEVILLQEGVEIARQPATAQDGAFSFPVESGVYVLSATKTGFASFRDTVEVLSSRHLSISMPSGAAVVKGKIYGRTWTSTGPVYAPITGAQVVLVDTSASPPLTYTATSDAVYGNFSISLPGSRTFQMHPSAEGFVGRETSVTVVTSAGKTHEVSDTLRARALLRGTVVLSETDNAGVEDVTIGLVDTTSDMVTVLDASDALGHFELRNISDGIYRIQAGREGYVADSILQVEAGGSRQELNILKVLDGRAVSSLDANIGIDEVIIKVVPGDKAIHWVLHHASRPVSDASIKLRSPMLKTLGAADTLKGVGPATYIMSVDAQSDTLLDLAVHRMTLGQEADAETADTVMLPYSHHARDTMTVDTNGTLTLTVTAQGSSPDTGFVFYRDIATPSWDSVTWTSRKTTDGLTTIRFRVAPAKNGSVMEYFFKMIEGSEIYGYEQETWSAYIPPDPNRLTRIEVVPSGKDTLLLPKDAEVSFRFRGYYGSRFVRDTTLQDDEVSWKLSNSASADLAEGALKNTSGLRAIVKTDGAEAANGVYRLTATVDTDKRRLLTGVDESVTVHFRISPAELHSITVLRTGGEGPVTTGESANFIAEGQDSTGKTITLSPQWEVFPETAGSISEDGRFLPAIDFCGHVRILASLGGVQGEYNRKAGAQAPQSGLEVLYRFNNEGDRVSNGRGCDIIFPAGIVPAGKTAVLSVSIPAQTNRIQKVSDPFTVVSNAFDIEAFDRNSGAGIHFDVEGTDSIQLKLAIPEDYRELARGEKANFYVARWNPDSLFWRPLLGSSVDTVDGSLVTVRTAGFSRYAVVYEMTELEAYWSISPNPFSPYIKPVNEFAGTITARDAIPFGTCIAVRPIAPTLSVEITVEIYNLVSERVVSVTLDQARPGEVYRLFWDGRTTERTVTPKNSEISSEGVYRIAATSGGGRMCRNGRYFVVLKIRDGYDNRKQYMKPVVLFK